MDPSGDAYLWWKIAHIVSVVAWMAGLFYLPRLFVYHALSPINSAPSRLLRVMEQRLLRVIMHPSLIVTVATGTVLSLPWLGSGWLFTKLGLVGILIVCHWFYTRWTSSFARDCNRHSHIFYRIVNEVPTIVLIGITVLVVLKPF